MTPRSRSGQNASHVDMPIPFGEGGGDVSRGAGGMRPSRPPGGEPEGPLDHLAAVVDVTRIRQDEVKAGVILAQLAQAGDEI